MFKLLALAAASVVSLVSANQVITPFGIRPKECVLELPSGAKFVEHHDGVEVELPTGEKYIHPVPAVCHQDNIVEKYMKRKLQAEHQPIGVGSDFAPINGWLDYAGWYPPSTENNLDSFVSTYTVPGNPPSDSGQVLFYFIGMQNNAYPSAVNILQPVLTWGNGIKGWNLASWCCCPKNITVQSKSITGFGAGDTIKGTIKRQSSVSWMIDSTIVKSGANTTLYPQVGSYLYDWADVTLEVYSLSACNQFAAGPMTFSGLVLKDQQQDTLAPVWKLTGPTQCNGNIKIVDAQTQTITHSNT
jgi:hypothetical protein